MSAEQDFFRISLTFERTDAEGNVLASSTHGARLNPEGDDFTKRVAELTANTVATYLPAFMEGRPTDGLVVGAFPKEGSIMKGADQ